MVMVLRESEVKQMKITKETTVENLYEAFRDFRGAVNNYLVNYNADLNFALFAVSISKMDKIHQSLFMVYLLEYWYAYTMDIINGDYKYVNVTNIVWKSWKEHMVH